MHIALAGPIATSDIAPLLDGDGAGLPAGYGGAPLLATLIGGLLRRGHQVSAFTLSRDLPLRRGVQVTAGGRNFRLHYLPMRPRAWPCNGWRPGRIVDLYRFERAALQRAIALAGPDVVHAHWAYEFAWSAVATGLPHLITCHDAPFLIARYYRGRGFRLSGYRWLRALMAWHVLRQARAVTTVSPYMVDQIQGLCRAAVQVIPNPIPDAALALRQEERSGPARILMVCNGWDRHKNPEPALRAMALLNLRLPEAELVAVGHGFAPGEAGSQWWRAQSLPGNVDFRGPQDHATVLAWMARSDLLLHPSLEESFGAVLAEAMAIGLPVVAGARSGAVPWVVGGAGRLVDVTRPEAIADALFALLSDRGEARRLGELGRRQSRARFAPDAVALAYDQAYQQVLQRAGRGGTRPAMGAPAGRPG